ncbi:hypothetical protein WR25_13525 [Diploscapter pachys]|uniref:Uncharacterized protein n=1 Tax=Diploscapter pachys TaxID=2018661 RepID=A0A2A2KFS5_9BILA|nr:hypothetical protein WR25_13525 [Diploscapter pachys]
MLLLLKSSSSNGNKRSHQAGQVCNPMLLSVNEVRLVARRAGTSVMAPIRLPERSREPHATKFQMNQSRQVRKGRGERLRGGHVCVDGQAGYVGEVPE